ncbi:hypothetical protein CONPUDRAFT_83342 [Coniophora puteana RWD-64-598 SS2]|uniref:F-box domain-containing protein n=1 Tax=Coniophora puteana (strain RWD-64-598) TaxID=741705 RepID=A0A5M3MIN1_CONPW|nr:uncharacterized protein CONPUDRAFT_83342 [Coniophora puteana RWD-64-598 SS2]EIW78963.1 hypothetical protein CONPUDRAFT_83342 [Coniophora puteana RWD-64-598 SS2]
MVQTFALPILHLATCGRVTPQRFWRIAMYCGWSEGVHSPGLEEVDYGEISDARDDIPKTIPWLKYSELRYLEELGDVEAIEDAIVHRGGYWMWMRPDRFPLDDVATQCAPSFVTHGVSKSNHTLSVLERLPLELLHIIAHRCSLTSLLSLASASRIIRFLLLGSETSRNSLAAAWITKNAPWFSPVTSGLEPRYEMNKVRDAWVYLQRCCASGSMRNRARIWKLAEQIEEVATRSGL